MYYYNTSNLFAEEPEGGLRLFSELGWVGANANRGSSCYSEA